MPNTPPRLRRYGRAERLPGLWAALARDKEITNLICYFWSGYSSKAMPEFFMTVNENLVCGTHDTKCNYCRVWTLSNDNYSKLLVVDSQIEIYLVIKYNRCPLMSGTIRGGNANWRK
uniref:Uncharacterized protein n=1 Tax=Ascaris lumbricoides TaxID=6252 RepID=A0A0M3HX02_ASCLU